MGKRSNGTRSGGANTVSSTRTFKSHGVSMQNQSIEDLAKNIAKILGSPKNVELKNYPGKKDSQFVSFNVDKKSYTILASKNFDGDSISIGTSKGTVYVKREKGSKEWTSGSKYGRTFNTLEDLEKWLKK